MTEETRMKLKKNLLLFSIKTLFLIIFGLNLGLFIGLPVFAQEKISQAQPVPAPVTGGTVGVTTATPQEKGEFFGGTLKEYLENLYVWSIGIAGMLAIIMLMYAGYQYASSMGNPDQVNQSKEIIVGALAGLALLILAALLLKSLGVS